MKRLRLFDSWFARSAATAWLFVVGAIALPVTANSATASETPTPAQPNRVRFVMPEQTKKEETPRPAFRIAVDIPEKPTTGDSASTRIRYGSEEDTTFSDEKAKILAREAKVVRTTPAPKPIDAMTTPVDTKQLEATAPPVAKIPALPMSPAAKELKTAAIAQPAPTDQLAPWIKLAPTLPPLRSTTAAPLPSTRAIAPAASVASQAVPESSVASTPDKSAHPAPVGPTARHPHRSKLLTVFRIVQPAHEQPVHTPSAPAAPSEVEIAKQPATKQNIAESKPPQVEYKAPSTAVVQAPVVTRTQPEPEARPARPVAKLAQPAIPQEVAADESHATRAQAAPQMAASAPVEMRVSVPQYETPQHETPPQMASQDQPQPQLPQQPQLQSRPQPQSLVTRGPSGKRSPALEMAVRNAEAQVRYGFELTQRGAVYAAAAQYREALSSMAQAMDAEAGTHRHNVALNAGLTALNEADDFVRLFSADADRTKLAEIIERHQTPLLKTDNIDQITPMMAVQSYCGYAAQQFGIAGGDEPAASDALYQLARVQAVFASESQSKRTTAGGKAMALHQAALFIDRRNYKAANELAVIYLGVGRLEDSRRLLEQAAETSTHPQTWRNLADVCTRMGDRDRAIEAQRYADQLAKNGNGNSKLNVRWVEPHELDRPSPDAVAVQRPAENVEKAASSPKTAAKSTVKSSKSRSWLERIGMKKSEQPVEHTALCLQANATY